MGLGNIAKGNGPTLQVIGVGDGATLYAYDLLASDVDAKGGATAVPLVDGVFELHALYGIQPSGGSFSWVKPEGDYAPDALMAGGTAAASLLKQIKAVRVGLIMRAALKEKEKDGGEVAPEKLVLFSDLGETLEHSRELKGSERFYRYRLLEATIPLRNNGLN
jgi:type IV pilus assembly protein PilW